jgi:hypothetical protein
MGALVYLERCQVRGGRQSEASPASLKDVNALSSTPRYPIKSTLPCGLHTLALDCCILCTLPSCGYPSFTLLHADATASRKHAPPADKHSLSSTLRTQDRLTLTPSEKEKTRSTSYRHTPVVLWLPSPPISTMKLILSTSYISPLLPVYPL